MISYNKIYDYVMKKGIKVLDFEEVDKKTLFKLANSEKVEVDGDFKSRVFIICKA